MSDTIRLFCGTSPNGEDYEAEAVYAHTARKFSSLPIEITFMRAAKKGPYSGWKLASGRTPFSAFRWSIPTMCGFEGRGIYTDVDFVFHADLAELWQEDIPGVIVTKTSKKPGGKIKTCCTLFDCAKAKKHVADLAGLRKMDDPQGRYSNYFKDRPELVSGYQSGSWNTIDDFDLSDPNIKATHYSRIEHQCHLPHAIRRLKAQGKSHWYQGPVFAHPNTALQQHFDAMLIEAQASGLTYESFQYGSDVEISRKNFTYSHHKGEVALNV
jgi:hypothetical protein